MSKSSKPISPLRQRMIDDMTMRNLKPATQTGYIRAARRLNEFLGSSPANATAEDLRLFQLHLSQTGTSAGTINATVSGLRFFFQTTLSKPEVLKNVTSVHEPRRLPIVPSRKDVTLVIDSAGSLKYKAAFSIAYGAGLRTNEVVHLKVSDIDSDRMVLRVDEGKGDKDRYAIQTPCAGSKKHCCERKVWCQTFTGIVVTTLLDLSPVPMLRWVRASCRIVYRRHRWPDYSTCRHRPGLCLNSL